jgi:hypothetical protein
MFFIALGSSARRKKFCILGENIVKASPAALIIFFAILPARAISRQLSALLKKAGEHAI